MAIDETLARVMVLDDFEKASGCFVKQFIDPRFQGFKI